MSSRDLLLESWASSPSARVFTSDSSGRGSSQCRLGGKILFDRANAVLMKAAMPAAGMQWPIIDLTLPIARAVAGSLTVPKNVFTVASSVRSPRTVPVPCSSR